MENGLILDGAGYIQDEPETSHSEKVLKKKKNEGWQKAAIHLRQTEEAPDGWS